MIYCPTCNTMLWRDLCPKCEKLHYEAEMDFATERVINQLKKEMENN